MVEGGSSSFYSCEQVEQIVTYLIVVQQLNTCPEGLETQFTLICISRHSQILTMHMNKKTLNDEVLLFRQSSGFTLLRLYIVASKYATDVQLGVVQYNSLKGSVYLHLRTTLNKI